MFKIIKFLNLMVYSPITIVIAFLEGVKFEGICFYDGYTFFSRKRGSQILIGRRCRFNSRVTSNLIGVNHKCIISTLAPNAIIKIGSFSGMSGVTIGCFYSVIIGNNVKIGANCLVTDGDWHHEDSRSSSPKEVIIEDNVWIGYNSIILKGVTIGANSLIGSGSVVTKDIPPNSIAVGNPCKVIKSLY